jgi:hypothetical protein
MSRMSAALSRSEKQGAIARAPSRGPPLTVTIDEACRKTGLGVTTLYALLKAKKSAARKWAAGGSSSGNRSRSCWRRTPGAPSDARLTRNHRKEKPRREYRARGQTHGF